MGDIGRGDVSHDRASCELQELRFVPGRWPLIPDLLIQVGPTLREEVFFPSKTSAKALTSTDITSLLWAIDLAVGKTQ